MLTLHFEAAPAAFTALLDWVWSLTAARRQATLRVTLTSAVVAITRRNQRVFAIIGAV